MVARSSQQTEMVEKLQKTEKLPNNVDSYNHTPTSPTLYHPHPLKETLLRENHAGS